MKDVDDYLKVRHAVRIEGLSERAAARRFGIDPRTVNKMMKFSVPPGYKRKKPPAKPKLDPFILVIDRILRDDKSQPKKQQHTAKRVFERLRDEYGFTGGITIVKDYVAGWRQRTQEMFVPLVHPPGHAQADFGEAIGFIGGVERKIHFLAFDLPHSDACFVVGCPAETTEAFCDGHVRAFAFFGGVPQSILYDNTKIALARILGDGDKRGAHQRAGDNPVIATSSAASRPTSRDGSRVMTLEASARFSFGRKMQSRDGATFDPTELAQSLRESGDPLAVG
jgi:transposase